LDAVYTAVAGEEVDDIAVEDIAVEDVDIDSAEVEDH
jgi:hypothetical protein